MTATCPNGHTSAADDYCDVCGVPIDASASASAPADAADAPAAAPPPADVPAPAPPPLAPPVGQVCPDCSTANTADALFCEACGYDFTTKTSARGSSAPAPAVGDQGPAAPTTPAAPGLEWVAEVWIDPDWYAAQRATDPIPSPGLPRVLPLRKTSLLIGRTSVSRNISPDIDCELDSAASRRQAQLTTDGTRWFVEDLQSANGTFVGPASGSLPDDPIPVGPKHELDPDDRVYVGAWTRIVIRRATSQEQTTL